MLLTPEQTKQLDRVLLLKAKGVDSSSSTMYNAKVPLLLSVFNNKNGTSLKEEIKPDLEFSWRMKL